MLKRPSRGLLVFLVVVSVLVPAAFAGSAAADPGITVSAEGDQVTVANASTQVIRGTADAPVGTEILVRVRSTRNTSPAFLKSESGVVTEDGTWAVAFNFSGIGPGGSFDLSARLENGSAETELRGSIVACEGDCTDTLPEDTPTPVPEQTQTPTRTEADSPVSFDENVFLVGRGNVAAIPLEFRGGDGADTAVIVVGNESEVNYELEAVVRDEDDDGQAVLYIDTSLAGRGNETVSVSGGDSVEVRSETSVNSLLDPASYDVALYAGSERTDEPTDVGTLVVQQQSSATPAEAASSVTKAASGTAAGGSAGSVASGVLVSSVFVVGGAALATVLLRR